MPRYYDGQPIPRRNLLLLLAVGFGGTAISDFVLRPISTGTQPPPDATPPSIPDATPPSSAENPQPHSLVVTASENLAFSTDPELENNVQQIYYFTLDRFSDLVVETPYLVNTQRTLSIAFSQGPVSGLNYSDKGDMYIQLGVSDQFARIRSILSHELVHSFCYDYFEHNFDKKLASYLEEGLATLVAEEYWLAGDTFKNHVAQRYREGNTTQIFGAFTSLDPNNPNTYAQRNEEYATAAAYVQFLLERYGKTPFKNIGWNFESPPVDFLSLEQYLDKLYQQNYHTSVSEITYQFYNWLTT